MQEAIAQLIEKSSTMGASIERAEIYAVVIDEINKALAKDDNYTAEILMRVARQIVSRSTSQSTSTSTGEIK